VLFLVGVAAVAELGIRGRSWSAVGVEVEVVKAVRVAVEVVRLKR